MKNLMTLIAVVFFASVGFSQTATVKGNANTLKKSLAENHISFTFPAEVKAEKVKQSSGYYTDYFTVAYSRESHTAKLTFKEAGNIAMAHRVVTRFLLSCGVRKVKFDGKEYSIMEFYSNYLK